MNESQSLHGLNQQVPEFHIDYEDIQYVLTPTRRLNKMADLRIQPDVSTKT